MAHHQVLTWDGPGMPSVHVEFNEDGDLVQVARAGGVEPWLTGWFPDVVGPGGGGVRRTHLSVDAEADELEQRWEVPGTPLQVRLRHTLDRTWQIRLVVRNTGTEDVPVRVRWRLTPGPSGAIGAHAAGGHATLRFADSVPGSPLLQAVLVQGDAGPGLGSHTMLEPGRTSVTTWKVDWADRQEAVPLPKWWPDDQVGVDVPVEINDPDVVVSSATVRTEGWEIPAGAGVRRVQVLEATRTTILEVLGVPSLDTLGDRVRGHVADLPELTPAEALVEVLLAGRDGVGTDAAARLRVGDDEPGLRRLLALHDPAGPQPAAADTSVPGFGHGLATLHALPFGLAPSTVPIFDGDDPVALADVLLTTEPGPPWEQLMARLAPVVGAWPVQPLDWSLNHLAQWVAVATMARHLDRPGVPDPEPLRRAVLARCHDVADSHLAAPLVWLLLD